MDPGVQVSVHIQRTVAALTLICRVCRLGHGCRLAAISRTLDPWLGHKDQTCGMPDGIDLNAHQIKPPQEWNDFNGKFCLEFIDVGRMTKLT